MNLRHIASISIPESRSDGTIVKKIKQNGVTLWDYRALSRATPSEIQAIIRSGTAAQTWKAGDVTAPITLNGTVGNLTFSNFNVRAFILGIDHNKTVESGGNFNVHFGFAMDDNDKNLAFCDSDYGANGKGFCMFIQNSIANGSAWGWEKSRMRSTICSAFLKAMPAEWQAIISNCTKYTNRGYSNKETDVIATTDKIFLLSEYEVTGTISKSLSYEKNKQQQYTYYKNRGQRSKFIHDGSKTSAVMWWTRSAMYSSKDYVYIPAASNGAIDVKQYYYSLGFAPAFMVA